MPFDPEVFEPHNPLEKVREKLKQIHSELQEPGELSIEEIRQHLKNLYEMQILLCNKLLVVAGVTNGSLPPRTCV